LKINNLTLIIFAKNVADTTCHQMIFSFPPHPMYASALPMESRSSEMCSNKQRTWKNHPQH